MSDKLKFGQNDNTNPLQPKKEVKGSSGLKEVRNKNHLLLPKNDKTPLTENGKNSLKRKRGDGAEDNSLDSSLLFKKFRKGIGLHNDKENRDPRSRDIGPNGQGDDAQKTKMAKYLREQLGISQEEIDKFSELGKKLSEIDPNEEGQNEAIKSIIEKSGLKPEQLDKFNKLLDASELNGQADQTNGEGPLVEKKGMPQKKKVNGEEISSKTPEVTQADIDKEIKKIERIRKWHDFIELMMAM